MLHCTYVPIRTNMRSGLLKGVPVTSLKKKKRNVIDSLQFLGEEIPKIGTICESTHPDLVVENLNEHC